jgi:hypothetical protein
MILLKNKTFKIFLLAGGIAIAGVADASARTAREAGLRLASKRPYSAAERECFADVFVSLAYKTPRNSLKVNGNKQYRDQLWSRCKIAR